jgi:hypothetical protein
MSPPHSHRVGVCSRQIGRPALQYTRQDYGDADRRISRCGRETVLVDESGSQAVTGLKTTPKRSVEDPDPRGSSHRLKVLKAREKRGAGGTVRRCAVWLRLQ